MTLLLIPILLTCVGFSNPQSNNVQPYFAIEASGRKYVVTDELLRGGWWNQSSQEKFRDKKTLYEKAATSSVKTFKKDFPDIWQLVKRISADVENKPFDGNIEFNPKQKTHKERFIVSGAKDGFDLDEEKLCRDILEYLKTGGKQGVRKSGHTVIKADVKVKSHRTPEQVISKIGLRGGYTTYFQPNSCRQHNIKLALGKFNGLVIRNGETVSFNQIVGPRTRDRGYREAKIILCGEFVPGVGGGVCQASTTLFNALLLSGVTIDKSYNHSRLISYVPVGRDAMVSSAADLRFTNNTGGTIYIESGINPAGEKSGSAFVQIYGNNTHIRYKPKTIVTESELKENEIDPARQSYTYIEAWNGERLVNSKLVRKSKYSAVKQKVESTKSQQS